MMSSKPLATRGGFTLIELMITITIIALMAGMLTVALFSAQDTSKARKTRTLIAKLDAIVRAKYESYKTRRVPLDLTAEAFTDQNGNGIWDSGEPYVDRNGNGVYDVAPSPQIAARMRLDALRDLMRLELPDRWTDITDNPTVFQYSVYGPGYGSRQISRPALSQGYLRQYNAIVTGPPPPDLGKHGGAECLYLIIMQAQQEEADDRSILRPENIADTDHDGFPEIVDAWGMPIKFLRWAPGLISDLQVSAKLTAAGGTTATSISATSPALASAQGSYVGGTIIKEDPMNRDFYLPTSSTRIVGYTYAAGTPGTGTFTCLDAVGTFSINPSEVFFVLPPDPFDPRRAYATTSFGLVPLIYSAGPNKCFGICADFDSRSPLEYSLINCNPYYVGTDMVDMKQRYIGTPRDDPGEDNYVSGGWKDNIHNHMLTAR